MQIHSRASISPYAIQAGREIRIIVKPEEIDDAGTTLIARDIVKKKIESELDYPGQIKVNVIQGNKDDRLRKVTNHEGSRKTCSLFLS